MSKIQERLQFAGTIAVVLSLVLVAFELRQNTVAQRSTAWQSTQDAEMVFDQLIMSADFAQTFLQGWTGGSKAIEDPVERFRFSMAMKILIDITATHHYQYTLGIIDQDSWQTWHLQTEQAIKSAPGFQEALWSRYEYYRPAFKEYVDAYRTE